MKKLYILLLLVSLFASCSGDLFDEPSTDELAIKLRSIWMVGGLSGNTHATVVSAVDMYDPVTNTWYPAVTSLPTPVSFAGAVSIKISDNDHRIYVFGGFDSGGNVLSTVQYYTIETGTWAIGTPITATRANIYAARLNNKIYIIGGTLGNVTAAYAAQSTTYRYTPASDTWDTMTAVTAGSEKFTMASGSVIYNLGGRTAVTGMVTTHSGLNLYVGATGTETNLAEVVLTSARTGIAGDIYESPYGDVMIIAGGFTALTGTTNSSILNTTSASTAINLVQYLGFPFGAAPMAWTNASGSFSNIGFGSAVVYYSQSLPQNYRFYYFGGTSSLTSTASGQNGAAWSDLPTPPNAWTNTWTSVANMPTGRYAFTAVKIQQ